LPLEGYKVIDMTHQVSGPFCTMLLADLGAEVIKVERPPAGDGARNWPYFGPSVFLALNRNKKSLALNLNKKNGKDAFDRLVRRSDILVENLAPGVAEKLGAGYKRARRLNKSIIYCSISGYGKENPYSDLPAWDPVIQAMAGLMSVTGEKDRAPVRIGVSVVDMGAGLFASLGVLSALMGRKSGPSSKKKSVFLDISLLDSAAVWMAFWITYYSLFQKVPERNGSAWPAFSPYQVLRANDGFVFVGASNEDYWKKLCRVLRLDSLPSDENFSTNELRLRHSEALVAILEEATGKLRTKDLIAKLRKESVPSAKVNSVSDLVADLALKSRKMLDSFRLDKSTFQSIANPLRASGIGLTRSRSPPRVGQDSSEILHSLGYSSSEAKKLTSSVASS
jgi:crotonobetainyl-CoA:carnitine CoA-transferase CaiB-like acyl-CoA transferase